MENNIKENIDNPQKLEQLYRKDKSSFKNEFNSIFNDIEDNKLADFWNIRLNFSDDTIVHNSKISIPFMILLSSIAAFISKFPSIFDLDLDKYYEANTAFIIFPSLIIFFIYRNKPSIKKTIFISSIVLFIWAYINFVIDRSGDLFTLSAIHVPLLLWAILGYTYVSDNFKSVSNRINYLRFNGELLILTILILIAGALLTGLTIGLFSIIDIDITKVYTEWIVVFGLAASPIVATFMIQSTKLVDKVSSVLAKVFSPLVLITLTVYLFASIGSDKDPFTDRDYLIIFNIILLSVMAIIFFAISENDKKHSSKLGNTILFALAIVTIIVNGIALSAIIFRISEWGFTPNRLAVLGSNILIISNLLMVAYQLFILVFIPNKTSNIGKSISDFLPIYSVWTIIVIFIFPLIF